VHLFSCKRKKVIHVLSSSEQAHALLKKLIAAGNEDGGQGKNEDVEVQFEGELGSIKIEIEGSNYHGTITGELAKGIWEFQLAMYRAGAFALHGVADIRKLTADQRNQLELVFEVREGSTDLLANLNETLKCLKEVFDDMSGTQKTIALITVALIIAGLLGFEHYSDNQNDILLEQEKTAQMKVVKDAAIDAAKIVFEKYEHATAQGVQAIVKGASDAESIRAGKAKLDRNSIVELNRKADRTQSSAEIVDTSFRVFNLQAKENTKDTFTVSAPDGREFSITADHAEFSEPLRKKIWHAAEKRVNIRLEVNVTIGADGGVKKAQLISIP
jgi:hypothetical protein